MPRKARDAEEAASSLQGLLAMPGSSTLPAQLYQVLEEAIIGGGLKPGQRLHADDIAAHYGVSRIPVRETLRALDAAGWIEIRPRYGTYVCERTSKELEELFDVRAELEGMAAARAAARRTEQELAELSRIVESSRDAAERGDDHELAVLDVQFYELIWATAHNSVLGATLAGMKKRARFYYSAIAPTLGRGWINVHAELLDAIRDQDAERADRVAAEHVRSTVAAIRGLVEH
ncbi:GntR family transcriptional regulator [Sphaerisporangium siamense]|uniref:DNA-binding GntR family transcriptional regulator n=1 Tax=Sphaerisporangium siamense TaxID=795645 RepID=A0A7W7G8M0_9ACTN|nr:GntR family transcriptional regulator [Sphaerisporangium siamense]MBB4699625.1 DNA-binding GntR family transcriptional regulator [Sphaerisporangium siamense]GII87039.1 GntR family transcriptional regulator [Sphaerisporangium siamense]